MKKNNKIVVEVLIFSLVFMASSAAVIPRANALESKQAWGQVKVEQSFWPYWWWLHLNTYNLHVWYYTGLHYGMEYIDHYTYDGYGLPFSGWPIQTENIDVDEFYMGASLIAVIFTATVKICNAADPNQWAKFVLTVTIIAGEDVSRDSYSFEKIQDTIPGLAKFSWSGIYYDYSSPYIIGSIYG